MLFRIHSFAAFCEGDYRGWVETISKRVSLNEPELKEILYQLKKSLLEEVR
jgi:hypothetical protein